MPGLGSTGPLAGYGTWGPTLTAYSGLTYLWNHPGQDGPVGSQGVYPDYLTGVMVPIASSRPPSQRRRTGKGAVIDVAQVDLAAYMLGTIFLDVLVNGRDAQPIGNDSAHMAPHGCYRCAGDDRYCVIAVETDAQWEALCRVMGDAPLAGDARFATFVERRRAPRRPRRTRSRRGRAGCDAFEVDGAAAGRRRPGRRRPERGGPGGRRAPRGPRLPADGQPPDPGRDHHGRPAHPFQRRRPRALPRARRRSARTTST